jgi:hypothetical protein
MSFVEMFRQMGVFALMTMLMAFVPLVVAVAYVIDPKERTMALMRPISLAAIFSALTGLTKGGIAVLTGIARSGAVERQAWGAIAAGSAESLVMVFVGFGCLTVAWLLVAFGMRRSDYPSA